MSEAFWIALLGITGTLLAGVSTSLINGRIQAQQQAAQDKRHHEELYTNREIEILSSLYVALVETYEEIIVKPRMSGAHPSMSLAAYKRQVLPQYNRLRYAAILAHAYVNKEADAAILAVYKAMTELLQHSAAKSTPKFPVTSVSMEFPPDKLAALSPLMDAAIDQLRRLLNPKSPTL